MKTQKNLHRPLAALAATGLLTAGFSLGHLTMLRAQDAPPPPAGERGAPPPPRDGGPDPRHGPREGGPGPRGERPPHPPRPEDDEPPAEPVDPQAAPTAVKTATDAAAHFTPGQVWTRSAPRGEPQLQATLLFQNREVARLEFDPANGTLLVRGQRPPMPPPAPGSPDRDPRGPRGPRGPGAVPNVPPPAAPAPPPAGADQPDNAPVPPALAAPVNLDRIKARLPEIIKGLSVGQGAEILGREGFWKVPLIYQSRVVGELHLSGDGTKVVEDFAAARDAAIFAR